MLRRKLSEQAETVQAKLGRNFKLFSSISSNSDSEEGQRMVAYLLNMASGRRFSCRATYFFGTVSGRQKSNK
jgi:hypothetical protein